MGTDKTGLCIALFLAIISLAACCESDEWRCDSGQCIAAEERCDGVVNCDDGSDETAENCIQQTCASFAFRCAYGACASGNAKCNGVKDCADNSDENPILCGSKLTPRMSKCQKDQFECATGECIFSENACDGHADCPDQSDETVENCASIQCPHFAFRCGYGACISARQTCNGVPNCRDGSDESASLCGTVTVPTPQTGQQTTKPTTSKPPVSKCIAPAIQNSILRYEADPARIIRSQEVVENGVSMQYTCKPGYNLEGIRFNLCYNSEWRETLQPLCTLYCPPLKGVTYEAVCEFDNHRVSCEDQIKPGTHAFISCQNKYRKPERRAPSELLCLDEGNWDYQPYRCEPICGEEPVLSQAFIANSDTTNITQVPWHVGIYNNFSARYKHTCGGTIINAKVIISAAHCFWDYANQKVYHKSNFAVAAGKTYRDYYHYEGQAQMQNISKIDIPSEFNGEIGQYKSDIAVIVLNDFLRFNTFISPVCIEWKQFAAKSIESGAYGRVAGWGKTEDGTFSEVLRSADLTATSYTECRREFSSYSEAIHDDKFCILNKFGTVVCQGDSGGGYAVKQLESNNKYVYYMWGVVSGGVPRDRVCPELSFVVYTNIQFHNRLIQDNEISNRPR